MFLTKQNSTMKEESASRTKFYENLETTIFELERTNTSLSRKHQIDKKRIQSLCDNIDYLEKKCEEMQGNLEQLETIRDEQHRKHYTGGAKMSKSSFFNYGSDSLSSEDSNSDFGFRTRSHSLHDLRRTPDEFDSGNSGSPTDLKTSESEFIFALESRIEQLLAAKKQEMEKLQQMETQLRVLLQENASLQEQLNNVQTEKEEQIFELRKQLLDTSNYAQQTLTLSMAAHLNMESFTRNPTTNNVSQNSNNHNNNNHNSCSNSKSLLQGDLISHSERKSVQSVEFPSSSQPFQNVLCPSNNSNIVSSTTDITKPIPSDNQSSSSSSSSHANISSELSPYSLNAGFIPSNLVTNRNVAETLSDQIQKRSSTTTTSLVVGPQNSCNVLCKRCSAEVNLLTLVNAIENDDEVPQDEYTSLEFELARATGHQSMRHSLNLYETQNVRDNDNSTENHHSWNSKSPWGLNWESNLPDLLPYAFEEDIACEEFGEEACEIPVDFVGSSSNVKSSRSTSKDNTPLEDPDDDPSEDSCLRKDRYPEKTKNNKGQIVPKFKLAKLKIPKKIPCDDNDDSEDASALQLRTESNDKQDSNLGDTVDSCGSKCEAEDDSTTHEELKRKKNKSAGTAGQKRQKGLVYFICWAVFLVVGIIELLWAFMSLVLFIVFAAILPKSRLCSVNFFPRIFLPFSRLLRPFKFLKSKS